VGLPSRISFSAAMRLSSGIDSISYFEVMIQEARRLPGLATLLSCITIGV
jgi:hypothetical protein